MASNKIEKAVVQIDNFSIIVYNFLIPLKHNNKFPIRLGF